jgi:hypothetical protein
MESRSEADWTPCDISIHGHYPYTTSLKATSSMKCELPDYWGPAGPYNTIFCNAVLLEDIYAEDSSQYQNIIGNYVDPGSFIYDQDTRWPHNIDLFTYILHDN